MNLTGASVTDSGPLPLAVDEGLWSIAIDRVQRHLELVQRRQCEPIPAGLAAASSIIRTGGADATSMLGQLRRVVVGMQLGSEIRLRCLRALARAGEAVDLVRLTEALRAAGRAPRIALTALAELAAKGDEEALQILIEELDSNLRQEAALLLSLIANGVAIDALSKHLRTPGPIGTHAAAVLLVVEDDPFAFEALCERLCDPSEALLAGRVLWNAAPSGRHLLAASTSLTHWERRGVKAAEYGRWMASVFLTVGRLAHDVVAVSRAIHSSDDEVVLVGAQAAYAVGDAENARTALLGLFRRGPTLASQAFQVLSRWADLGDERAMAMLRGLLERRPIDLSRTAIFDALAATTRPALRQVLSRGIVATDRHTSLEACRALMRLREPPSIIPPLWL